MLISYVDAAGIIVTAGIATFTDIRGRVIPNWLVYGSLLVGVGVNAAVYGWHTIALALLAILITIPINLAGFLLNEQVGAGDLKLYAAIAAWIATWQGALGLVVLSWLANALISILALFIMPEGRTKLRAMFKREKYDYGIPHAPAVALGVLGLLLMGGIA